MMVCIPKRFQAAKDRAFPARVRRVYRRSRDDDNVITPRCPRCRYWLIARQNQEGPYFFCLCSKAGQRQS